MSFPQTWSLSLLGFKDLLLVSHLTFMFGRDSALLNCPQVVYICETDATASICLCFLEASWPLALFLTLHPPSSSSSPTHIPMLPTHSTSIHLSITAGWQRNKHFMWCMSVGLHIFLILCPSAALLWVWPPHLKALQQSIHISATVRLGRGRH